MDVNASSPDRPATPLPRLPSRPIGRRLARRLRGRWRAIWLVAGLLTLIGAGTGFLAGQRYFEAAAMLSVTAPQPAIADEALRERLAALAEAHLTEQLGLVRDPAVLIAALRDPEWPDAGAPQTVETLRQAVATRRPATAPDRMAVTLTGTDRSAAGVALRRLIKAYAEAYVIEDQARNAREVIAVAEVERTRERLAAATAAADALRRAEGFESVDAAVTTLQHQLAATNAQLADKQVALAAALPGDTPTADGLPPRERLERLARTDPELSILLEARLRGEQRVAELRRRMGPQAPPLVQARDELAATDTAIANRLRSRGATPAAGEGTAGATPQRAPWAVALTAEELRRQVDQLTRLRDRLTEQLAGLRAGESQLREAEAGVAAAEAAHAQARTTHERLLLERRVAGNIAAAVEDDVTVPASPVRDTRLSYAGVGAGAGLLLGLLGAPLVFFFDNRMRRPESADLHDPAVPLYGSVPQLTQDDPLGDGADLTALAIHEIRGLMQIRARRDGAKAFAITSPSRGSGKTSLTVGLASSLALSGSRTLLVDCDLAGRVASVGGSKRPQPTPDTPDSTTEPVKQNLDQVMLQMGYLDENDPEVFLLSHDASIGITGMLEGGSLAHCVIDTSVPNLSVLPALSATQQHIGRMSGQFIRRLIDEASGAFDLIVFDTGPIPGSVEALFVTSEADATILVTSRGESQDRFDKTVAYLKVVGARLAGTVFNRAAREDLRIQGLTPPRPAGKRGRDQPAPPRKPAAAARQLAGSGLLAAAVHQQADRAIGDASASPSSREEAARRRFPPARGAAPGGAGTGPSADNTRQEKAGLLGPPDAAPHAPPRARNGPAAKALDTDNDLEDALDALVNEVRVTGQTPPRDRGQARPDRPA